MATRRAILAVLAVGAAAEAIVLAMALVAPAPRPGPAAVAGGGAALFYAFHHVALVFEVPRSLFPPLEAAQLAPATSVTLAWAPVTATAAVLWALSRAGRAVAETTGGEALARGLHGLKVAPPYALLCFVLSFAVRVRLAAGDEPGPMVHPDPLSALLWPLALGAVAGFAGGLWSLPEGSGGRWGRWVRGAATGGWRMLWTGLALSFIGLLVLAALKPQDTTGFVDAVFSGGPVRGTVLVILAALVVPNVSAWVLAPALGSCTGLSGALSWCVLSYGQYPGGGIRFGDPPLFSRPIELPPVPPAHLLFLLVPMIAVLVGGLTAARAGAAEHPGEAAGMAAAAGAVFGALMVMTALLTQVSVGVDGGQGGLFPEGALHGGPQVVSGALLAATWGVVGGALGGWIWWGRRVRPGRSSSEERTEADAARDQPESVG